MKKSLIFFPVFMLLLGGCGTNPGTSGTGTSAAPTSSVAPAPSSSGVAPTSSQGSSVTPVSSSSETPPVTQYTITWKDDLGNNLKVEQVAAGVVPSYGATNPTKDGDAQYSYEFDHWDPTPVAATANAVYTAVFTSTVKKYTISFVDGDGKELQSSQVEYGTTPSYSGETPTKTAGAHTTYTWDGGWDPALAPVTGNATYEATFDENVDKYTVRFLVDGVQYGDPVQVEYGKYAPAPGVAPSKAPDAEVARYVFDGWDGIDQPITENTDLNASFIEYAVNEFVDDFESYDEDNPLDDNGWSARKLDGSEWKTTSATVTLSENSVEANQALRFDGYRNGLDFGVMKEFNNDAPDRFANAIRFRVMAPTSISKSKVIMNFDVDNQGTPLEITLKHDIDLPTAEYFEMTIPFRASGWDIWDTLHDVDIYAAASSYGVDASAIPTMLKNMIFYFKDSTSTPERFTCFIDSISFITVADDVTDISVNDTISMGQVYTGNTNSGHIVKLSVTGPGEATASVIDTKTPINIPGSISLNGHDVEFHSTTAGLLDYVGKVTDGGQKINFVSGTSIDPDMQADINGMKLMQVQVVDNFEQYTDAGSAYWLNNRDENNISGMRANYYAERYGASSAADSDIWGGANWDLMGVGDAMRLKTDGGHSGSKYIALQGSQTKAMRYLSWKSYKGNSDTNSFRGNKMSFWAKSVSGFNVSHITLYAFSKYNPQPGDINTGHYAKKLDVTGGIPTTWTHYEIELNPNGVYYGFMILVEKTPGASGGWLHIDDVEVYSADPRAFYKEPVTGVFLDEDAVNLEKGQQATLTATVTPDDAYNKAVNWTSNNASVATVSNGVVQAVGKGNATITATTVDGGYTDTCEVTVTAPLKSYPEGTYKAVASMGGADHTIVIALGNESNGLVAVRIDNADAAATGVTWTSGTKEITIATTGSYSSLTYGNITATFDPENDKLINIAFDGTIASVVPSSGSIEASVVPMWECDGTDAELQAMFKRRYDSGSGWQTDTGNTDRFKSNTAEFVSGTGSMKRRAHASYKVAHAFNNDFSPAKAVKNIHFWVYNPGATDINLRIWIYKGTGLSSNAELTANARVAKHGQWTYISLGTDATIYNFQIAVFKEGTNTDVSANLSFDNIAAF